MDILWLGLGLALLVFSHHLPIQAQSQSKLPAKATVVAGTVTLKGKPAGGIVVVLRQDDEGQQPNRSFKAKTDPAGRYRITGAPPETHYVTLATSFFLSRTQTTREVTQ